MCTHRCKIRPILPKIGSRDNFKPQYLPDGVLNILRIVVGDPTVVVGVGLNTVVFVEGCNGLQGTHPPHPVFVNS